MLWLFMTTHRTLAIWNCRILINFCAFCAIFTHFLLPRDAMQAQPMSSCDVCPHQITENKNINDNFNPLWTKLQSNGPLYIKSVTFVNRVKTNEHIFRIFHHRVAKPF